MNINTYIKDSIAKGVSKGTYALRREIAALKRDHIQFRRSIKDLSKKQASIAAQMPKPVAEDVDAGKYRRPGNGAAVRKVRTKLGLTQAQFGKLVKVTAACVTLWEQSPKVVGMRASTLKEFGKARGMTKKAAKAALGLK